MNEQVDQHAPSTALTFNCEIAFRFSCTDRICGRTRVETLIFWIDFVNGERGDAIFVFQIHNFGR